MIVHQIVTLDFGTLMLGGLALLVIGFTGGHALGVAVGRGRAAHELGGEIAEQRRRLRMAMGDDLYGDVPHVPEVASIDASWGDR